MKKCMQLDPGGQTSQATAEKDSRQGGKRRKQGDREQKTASNRRACFLVMFCFDFLGCGLCVERVRILPVPSFSIIFLSS